MSETEDYDKSATPLAHKTTHQDGGTDEISVQGLSGALADNQPSSWALVSGKPSTFAPEAHKTSHQDTGSDEISVLGLSGLLADGQTPLAHKTSHQAGGSDALSVAGLSGLLATDQTPAAHKTSHQLGGSDALSVAGLSGLLADAQTPLLTGLTTGYLPYKPAGALADSPFSTDGTNIGLGIPTPIDLFHLNKANPTTVNYLLVSAGTFAHAMTAILPTNAFGRFSIVGYTQGGFGFSGFSNAAAVAALTLLGAIGVAAPTAAAIDIRAYKSDGGTSIAALANSETIMNIKNGNAVKVQILGDGSTGIGKPPTTPLDVAGKIRTDVTLNAGLKTVGHYFTMNVNGTDVNVLCE